MEIQGHTLRKFILLYQKLENLHHLKAPDAFYSLKLRVALWKVSALFVFSRWPPRRLNIGNEVQSGVSFQRSQILYAKPSLDMEQYASFLKFSIPNLMHIKYYGM